MPNHMLSNILSHTPAYVWAILAFLVWRGVSALRAREVALRTLFIVPLAMLGLSLHDIGARFGLDGAALGAWGAGALSGALLAWKLGGSRIGAGAAPGSVRVAGSVLPLLLMLAIFFTKYLAAVLLAIQPGLRHDAAFVAALCALFGVFNGWFGGRLARDLAACRALPAGRAARVLA